MNWNRNVVILIKTFSSCCTGSCHVDNFQCSHWWKFHQNGQISVPVSINTFNSMVLPILINIGSSDLESNSFAPVQLSCCNLSRRVERESMVQYMGVLYDQWGHYLLWRNVNVNANRKPLKWELLLATGTNGWLNTFRHAKNGCQLAEDVNS